MPEATYNDTCPKCGADLSSEIGEGMHDGIYYGTLECYKCGCICSVKSITCTKLTAIGQAPVEKEEEE